MSRYATGRKPAEFRPPLNEDDWRDIVELRGLLEDVLRNQGAPTLLARRSAIQALELLKDLHAAPRVPLSAR